VRLAGDLIGDVDERGEPIVGDSFLLLLNAHYEAIPFTLPVNNGIQKWEWLLDTAQPQAETFDPTGKEPYLLQGRSMVVLRAQPPQQEAEGPAQG
jgi:glycogen operon protein